MNLGASLALASVLASGLVSVLLGRRARRLERQLQSLARPLHELRGALSAFELVLSLVDRSRRFQEDLHGYLDTLQLSAQRAALGVRDIEALRHGDADVLDARSDVEFDTLVLRSARAWSLLAPSYGASLEVEWRAGSVRVVGHAGRLQQALDNLIANALEHGGGRVLVEGELRGRLVRVLVSDGGHGLPGHLEDVLSQNGNRAATLPASKHSVRGHGISIVSEVIREHHGRLGLGMGRNGPGLVIELPMMEGEGGAPAPLAVRAAPSPAYDHASKAA